MAKYTIELRKICDITGRETVESWFKDYDLKDYLTDEEISVIYSRGTFDKDKLAKRIVDYYYMREIAHETIPLFIHQVKVKMNEIMERQSYRIYSASIKYNPLINVDYTESFNRESNSDGNSKSSSSNSSSGIQINSDTPQGQINKDKILDGNYATSTNGNETNSSISDDSQTSSNQNENYIKTVRGNSGVSATAQAMIKQYRQNIIEINNDIIKELRELFFSLY